MWCSKCGMFHDGLCPNADDSRFDFSSSYKPPEPLINPVEPPTPPPPTLVKDIHGGTVGNYDRMANTITPMTPGSSPLDVGPGGYVRDVMGNVVGHLGPGDIMLPPPGLPGNPDTTK